jgi:hypothetical protein
MQCGKTDMLYGTFDYGPSSAKTGSPPSSGVITSVGGMSAAFVVSAGGLSTQPAKNREMNNVRDALIMSEEDVFIRIGILNLLRNQSI